MITTVALGVALAATAGWWLPQLRRRGDGVATATWLMMAGNAAVWGLWAVNGQQWLFASVQAIQLVGCIAVAATNGVHRRDLTQSIPLVALVAMAMVPSLASAAAVVASVWLRIPQLVRNRRTTSGVAGWSWVLNTVSNGAWAAWGVLVGEPTVVIGCTVAAAGSALVVLGSRFTAPVATPTIADHHPNPDT
jgi:hypothetical protein